MTSCRCESCRPDDPAPTYTRAWRAECEARTVLAIPTLEERREYLAKVAEKRGTAGRQQLEDVILRLHKQAQTRQKGKT